MRRSWLVWATSIVAFFLTVTLIVISGPAINTRGQATPAPNSHTVEKSSLAQKRSPAQSRLRSFRPAPTDTAKATGHNTSFQQPPASPPATPSGVPAPFSKSVLDYQPAEVIYLADPTNYGERLNADANGNPLDNEYIVVLHETVGSASSAINTFQTPHPNDADQVSYHTLIALDGTVVYVVSPEQRAFGAGNSAFQTPTGEESVSTNPAFPSSVNNFAYHISLETPPDGQNNGAITHSGYSDAQYRSLAWLLARTTVPDSRITTHRDVDRSGSRIDPRSFEPSRLFSLLQQYPNRANLN
ncbi:MAG: peptidoglycan recognition family protein [Cyanobacteria bacterium J06626_6]